MTVRFNVITLLFSALLLTGIVGCTSKSEQPSQIPSRTTTSSTTSASKTPLPEWNDLKFKDWCSLLSQADRAPYFKTEEKIKISSDPSNFDEAGPGCIWHTDVSLIVIHSGDLTEAKERTEALEARQLPTSKGLFYVQIADSDLMCMMSIAYPGSQKVSIDFSIMRPAELVSNKKEKLCDIVVPLVEKIIEKIAKAG